MNFLNQKKGIYEKSAANIILNVKRINVFHLNRKKGRVSAFILLDILLVVVYMK